MSACLECRNRRIAANQAQGDFLKAVKLAVRYQTPKYIAEIETRRIQRDKTKWALDDHIDRMHTETGDVA